MEGVRTVSKKIILFGVIVLVMIWLTGCIATSRNYRSSSVSEYLYPNKKKAVTPNPRTNLELPVKIGLAFVPDVVTGSPVAEDKKQILLMKVREAFEDQDFVEGIEVIPSTYLMSKGGFENLRQVANAFNVKVMALVSYDQIQFQDPSKLSLLYWTLIGSYFIRGELNETRTMLEAVVYDVPSARLLFRAPGISVINDRSTIIDVQRQLRIDSDKGLTEATDNLITNLHASLKLFKEQLKETDDIVVSSREGRSFSAFGLTEFTIVLFILLLLWKASSRRSGKIKDEQIELT